MEDGYDENLVNVKFAKKSSTDRAPKFYLFVQKNIDLL